MSSRHEILPRSTEREACSCDDEVNPRIFLDGGSGLPHDAELGRPDLVLLVEVEDRGVREVEVHGH